MQTKFLLILLKLKSLFSEERKSNLTSKFKDIWEKAPSIKLCKISRYIFDEYLNWSPHINHLSHKLVKGKTMLCKLCRYVNKVTIKSVYYAIFCSHLSCVCTAWGQNLNPKHCISLLQKKAVQIISFACYDAHALPILAKLNIIKFSDIILLCNCSSINILLLSLLQFFSCFHTSI